MVRTYEVDANNCKMVFNNLHKAEVDRDTRFKIKKLEAAMKDSPEYVVDKDGESWWCIDVATKAEGAAKVYQFKKNADGKPINTCRISVSEEIVDATVWELHFKPLRSGLMDPKSKASLDDEDRFDHWAAQWGLAEKFERKSVAQEEEPKDAVETK